ncbi:protein patched homolog 1 isoform X1 [Lates japonicus]|uniref:Protein patched homolog 1 isoform X1 n=1 Tax=Lates japonicus TaxID=270547 RepID=A0AAD3R3Y7_LATJO|nr:protein patched homolog 1 isoform X1 [Lates japonicus]
MGKEAGGGFCVSSTSWFHTVRYVLKEDNGGRLPMWSLTSGTGCKVSQQAFDKDWEAADHTTAMVNALIYGALA